MHTSEIWLWIYVTENLIQNIEFQYQYKRLIEILQKAKNITHTVQTIKNAGLETIQIILG